MKRYDKNKSDFDEISKDDNMTFGQEGMDGDNIIDDNMSEEEDLLNEEDIDGVEDLQTKFDELNNSYLRLHAEFDNYRKRTLKEKIDIIKAGGEKALTEMIPLVDDFERALETVQNAKDKEAIVEGMEFIYSKFI